MELKFVVVELVLVVLVVVELVFVDVEPVLVDVPSRSVIEEVAVPATKYDQRAVRKDSRGVSVAGARHGARCSELRPSSVRVSRRQKKDVVEACLPPDMTTVPSTILVKA